MTQKKILFIIFIVGLVLTSSSVESLAVSSQPTTSTPPSERNAQVTCFWSRSTQTTTITTEAAHHLLDLFTRLAQANAQDPSSPDTQRLQDAILAYADANHLLPSGQTAATVHALLEQQSHRLAPLDNGSTDTAIICNFITTGNGVASPLIILPRLIPFIQLPIPRIYVGWKTQNGATSLGHLITKRGMLAGGEQQGFAIGFWGIGFSIFLPPVCAYGLFGWAGYAKVTAEKMEYWPPNHHPTVTAIYPLDGATHVPTTTPALKFRIEDNDNDFMSYNVTTSPNIGGANVLLRKTGTYTVPITGLQPATLYTWTIVVSDGKDTTTATYTFTTEGTTGGQPQ